jgi:hypothetical protein
MTQRRGRPLVPNGERLARWHAAELIEGSTLPPVEIAKPYRAAVSHNVAQRQYRWAGFVRRVAELLEGDLYRHWPSDKPRD